ncbi:MAG: heavy metal-binding domain-containing protein [Nitrospirota bacterium]
MKICLQCHTPLAGKEPTWRAREPAGEETDAIARIERRRRARPRERTVARNRTQERPPEQTQKPPWTERDRGLPAGRQAPAEPAPSSHEATEEQELHGVPSAPLEEPAPAGSVTQLVDRLKQVIVTTTPEVQHREVADYKGVVTAGAVVRLETLGSYIDGVKDVGALRAAPFYEQLRKARDIAMTDLKIEAAKLGANAVVAVTFQYEQSPSADQSDRLIWIIATGTAVLLAE